MKEERDKVNITNKLNIYGRFRIVILTFIMLIFTFFSIGYSYEVSRIGNNELMVDVRHMGKVIIDGSDFTLIFMLFALAWNFTITLVKYGILAWIIVIQSIITVIIFKGIAIRKSTEITGKEYKMTNSIVNFFMFCSFVLGVVVTKCTSILLPVLNTLAWGVFVKGIYCNALAKKTGFIPKKKRRKQTRKKRKNQN